MAKTVTTPINPKAALANDPEYQAAVVKGNQLKARLDAADAELQKALGLARKADGEEDIDFITTQALELMHEGVISGARAARRQTIAELELNRTIAERAVGLHHRKLDEIRYRVGLAVSASHAPQHKDAVQGMSRALVEFAKHAKTEDTIRTNILEAGLTVGSIRAMPVREVGFLEDPYSLARRFLQEAKDAGLLNGKEDFLAGIKLT